MNLVRDLTVYFQDNREVRFIVKVLIKSNITTEI